MSKYILEVQTPRGWVALCEFCEPMWDSAVAYCRIFAMSEKTTVRLREDQMVVHEAFYDRSQDPDARDWDTDSFGSEQFDISWQKCGF